MKKLKKIQFYPNIGKLHSLYISLINKPPKGYEFIFENPTFKNKLGEKLKIYKPVKYFYKGFTRLFKTLKVLEFFNDQKDLSQADLVYALGTSYSGNKPFIIDIIDTPFSLSGNKYDLFIKNKNKIKKYLENPNCKKIICPHETALKFMRNNFEGRKICRKLSLVRQAFEPVPYKIPQNKFSLGKKVRVLFMGSINNSEDFYTKGGLEAVLAFKRICNNYNCELIIRCRVPERVKKIIKGNKKIKLIENQIDFNNIIKLYSSSDFLLLPNHFYTIMATLESMSFKLPIISLDTYAVKHYIKDGYNGFVVKPSERISEYFNPSYPTNLREKKFTKKLWEVDQDLIDRISKRIIDLIEDPKLRKKMGNNAYKFFKNNFSIKKRNKKLKKIFDNTLN